MSKTQSVMGNAQRGADLAPTLVAQANWDLKATEKKKDERQSI
jgi:hypothetical protein